jgi:HEPN domain-containing protein
MKDETKIWLEYAKENLASAQILLDHDLFNPCLQNAQQAVEKMLKALLIESGIKVRKTHGIGELITVLAQAGWNTGVTDDEADVLDSIYLPSKYPLGSVLPDFEPDREICARCIDIASRLRESVARLMTGEMENTE